MNALFEESGKASEKAKEDQRKLQEQLNALQTKKEQLDLKLQQEANALKDAKEERVKLELKHAKEIEGKRKSRCSKVKVQERRVKLLV